MQNRILEQAKMLSVENLLAPTKGKSQKKSKSQKNVSSSVEQTSEAVEVISESTESQIWEE